MRQLKIGKSITSRDSIALNKYLQEISHYNMVTADEEVSLAQRIKNGDLSALEKLVCANLRFAFSVAKQYESQGVTLADLVNEANMGLIKAAQKFDETRGFKFISYAVWWIRQSILQAIAEKSRMVRLPLNQVGMLGRIGKATSEYEQIYGWKPSVEELSTELGESAEKISDAIKTTRHHISMDAPFIEGEDNSLLDVMVTNDFPSTDSTLIKESLTTEVEKVMDRLPKRERDILRLSFGIGCQEISLEEIGSQLNLTRERVRQIKEKAIRNLRGEKSRILQSYLAS